MTAADQPLARAQAAPDASHEAGIRERDILELVYDRAQESWVPVAEAEDPDPYGGPYTIYDPYGEAVTELEVEADWEAEAGQ